jgi:hypothetical protein
MGHVVTPTYRVELGGVVDITIARRVSVTPQGWDVKRYGSPTEARLDAFVADFEEATLPGGVNEHCGILRVGSAKIVRQSDDRVIVEWTCPMFRVVL